MKNLNQGDFLWIAPSSLGMGALLASLQPGNWIIGWLGFSFLFLLCASLLTVSARWAGGGKTLAWMIALAFVLRFSGGVATYLALPVYGYVDEDQSAGFVYTDAHRRDAQAWELAGSDRPITDAFNEKFAYDQYGGLLAFSALIYRYLSPDAHRVLMLVLLSAFMGALGVPFLWKAVSQEWGTKVAFASGWVFALYPESVLLGGSAMREPYLMACSAFALWGFVNWGGTRGSPFQGLRDKPLKEHTSTGSARRSGLLNRQAILWISLGIVGMLLVSPSVALVTLVIFLGWHYFTSERGRISRWMVVIAVLVFIAGLLILSSALDRQGKLGGGSPIGVINNFMREAVKWDVYQLERGSGWVQKLFDEMPEWLRLPFVTLYGILQPVLPAIFIVPTTSIWRIIGILRAVGWYTLLPALILTFSASAGVGAEKERKLLMWLSLVVWVWVLLTALRGGGDQWDNPRYRAILFLWQAILAGNVWVWWRETRNAWCLRVIAMEIAFVAVFGQWYANRYLHIGPQLPFAEMVTVILGLWGVILVWGIWRDRRRRI